jgi:fatty acyl-ACP thioesterase A
VWVAFNLQKRRMARIPQNVVDLFQNQQLCDEPVMGADYQVTKIPETGPDAHVAAFQVRRRDVDMNGHVNNVVYTEWLLEGVPESAWAEFELKEIEIEFRAEATFGETVETRCDTETYVETDDPRATDGKIRMVHQLMKQGEENPKAAEVVRARTYWVPKK